MTSSGKQPCLLRQHHGRPGWVPLRKALWASPNITSADGTIRNRLAFLLDLAAQDPSLMPFQARSETCIPCPPSTLELHFLGAFPTALRVWACHKRIAIILYQNYSPAESVKSGQAPHFVLGNFMPPPPASHTRPITDSPSPRLSQQRPSPIIKGAPGKIKAPHGTHTNSASRPRYAIAEPRAQPYNLRVETNYTTISHHRRSPRRNSQQPSSVQTCSFAHVSAR